jgi:putative transposase
MRDHEERFPVRVMCRALAVSPAGYYAWAARPESRRTAANRRLVTMIRVIHAESREQLRQPPSSRDTPGPGRADR